MEVISTSDSKIYPPGLWLSYCLSPLVQLHQRLLPAQLKDNVDKVGVLKVRVELDNVGVLDHLV